MLRLSSTTGQRQRKEEQQVSRNSPGWRFPQGQRVSVPDCRKGLPAFPRRRQEVCACADRPAETFFLFHRARRIFFLMSLCGAPAAPRAVGRGGARERTKFSPSGGNEVKRTLRLRCHASPVRDARLPCGSGLLTTAQTLLLSTSRRWWRRPCRRRCKVWPGRAWPQAASASHGAG